VLAGWNHISRLIQFNGDDLDEEVPHSVKVLSYNLQNFLKINTSTTKYVTDFKNEVNIKDFLEQENADVVCLQEMLHDRESQEKFAADLARQLKCPNYHYVNYFARNTKILDAIAIFTRFPVINRGELEYEDKSIGIFTDLVIDSDTVRVYNLHLASIHFKQEDYEFWSDMGNKQEQEKFRMGTVKILSKMQSAFLKRAGQSDIIAAHIESCPWPVIICGDFNDTPSSYAYNRLSQSMKDAFVESGSGLGITYAGKYFPAFRIDFILYDQVFTSMGFTRHKVTYSDHFPITTYLYHN
jgi:endonuclease/exonuclease/phosphatase family metal-dependent hydrolase